MINKTRHTQELKYILKELNQLIVVVETMIKVNEKE
jgi:hypothetical protein